jgi:hypothetical protein
MVWSRYLFLSLFFPSLSPENNDELVGSQRVVVVVALQL